MENFSGGNFQSLIFPLVLTLKMIYRWDCNRFEDCVLLLSLFKGALGEATITHGISETIWFSSEIAHIEKDLISISQEFSSSIGKAFILAGRLGAELSFYGV